MLLFSSIPNSGKVLQTPIHLKSELKPEQGLTWKYPSSTKIQARNTQKNPSIPLNMPNGPWKVKLVDRILTFCHSAVVCGHSGQIVENRAIFPSDFLLDLL
jgi:hypothetical protein